MSTSTLTPQLTDAMVDGMDDTAGLLRAHKPATRQSAFFWRGQPSVIGALLRPSNKDRSANGKANRYSYPIEGREAGQKAFDKRQALKRAGI